MPNAILWTVNSTLTEQTTNGYLVQNSDNRAARMAATNSYADRLKHDSDKLTIVEPVYLKSTALPVDDMTTAELCITCERVSGYGTMEAAQLMGGLWRLYPKNREARASLLTAGLGVNGVAVPVYDKNPFLLFDGSGDEIASTKVIISNVPLSASNDDLIGAIEAQGVTLLSKMRYELARDKSNRLTRFKTGRRQFFIAVPDTPLPRKMQIGHFKAEVYHKEQRQVALQATRECYKCLETGHIAATCENPIKCRDCRAEGHRSGDPACGWVEQAALFEGRIHAQKDNDSVPLPSSDNADEKEVKDTETVAMEESSLAPVQGAAGNTTTSKPLPSPKAQRHATVAEKTRRKLFAFKSKQKRNADECDGDDDKEAAGASKKKAVDNT